jgi:hypothetical protein
LHCARAGISFRATRAHGTHGDYPDKPMDDLDRLFLLLVHRVGGEYPDHLHDPFEVAELYQSLVPYRHYRRELGIETNGDYELALVRLLSGERGYLQGQSDMQEAVKKELAGNNPNTSIFREYAASRVALPSDAVRRAEHVMSRRGGGTPAATAARAAASPEAAAARQSAIPLGHNEPITPSLPAPPVAAPVASARPSAEQRTVPGASDDRCRYCSGGLPSDRSVTYCPHCGQNLTIRRCPACATELDLAWKFCITCGRGV